MWAITAFQWIVYSLPADIVSCLFLCACIWTVSVFVLINAFKTKSLVFFFFLQFVNIWYSHFPDLSKIVQRSKDILTHDTMREAVISTGNIILMFSSISFWLLWYFRLSVSLISMGFKEEIIINYVYKRCCHQQNHLSHTSFVNYPEASIEPFIHAEEKNTELINVYSNKYAPFFLYPWSSLIIWMGASSSSPSSSTSWSPLTLSLTPFRPLYSLLSSNSNITPFIFSGLHFKSRFTLIFPPTDFLSSIR